VLVLSTIEYIGANTCPTGCTNLNHAVFTQQLTLGNSALHASAYGTVPASSMSTDGTGTVTNPTTDASVHADGILNLLTMTDGQFAYVAETFSSASNLSIPGFTNPSNGVYVRAIF
jgi:hypothetical protein